MSAAAETLVPRHIERLGRELHALGHDEYEAYGVAFRTLRSALDGSPHKLRGTIREDLTGWSAAKRSLTRSQRERAERAEGRKPPVEDLRKLSEALRHRLVVAEGILSASGRGMNPLIEASVKQLLGEQDDLVAAVREEADTLRVLVEAVSLRVPPAPTPTPGEALGRGRVRPTGPHFDAEHPREPKGRTGGGEFAKKNGGKAAAAKKGGKKKGGNPALQQIAELLDKLGFDLGDSGVTDRMTKDLRKAITFAQKKYGLRPTGEVSTDLRSILNREVSKRKAKLPRGQVALSADQMRETTVEDSLRQALVEAVEQRKAAHEAGDGEAFTLAWSRERAIRGRIQETSALTESGGDTMGEAMREATDSRSLPDLPNKPNKTNWVEKAGGLPRYIERIAKHLHSEKGMTVGRAIATAVNVVKKMCASGELNFPGHQSANAGSRAEACKAVAQWEAKKGKSKVTEALTAIQESRDAGERPFYPSAQEAFLIFEWAQEMEVRERLTEAGTFRPDLHPRDRLGKFDDVLAKLTSGPGSRGGGLHVGELRSRSGGSVSGSGSSGFTRTGAAGRFRSHGDVKRGAPSVVKDYDPATRTTTLSRADAKRKRQAEDVMGSITPGHTKHTAFGTITRGFGDESDIYALQHGGKVTKRGTSSEVSEHIGASRPSQFSPGVKNDKGDTVQALRADLAPRGRPVGAGRSALPEEYRDVRSAMKKPGVDAGSLGDLSQESIGSLASIIRRDWPKVNFGAVPYLDAMRSLNTANEMYGLDTGKSIISYFLSNASGWRGETAKAVKAELKRRLREAGEHSMVRSIERIEEAYEKRQQAHDDGDAAAFSVEHRRLGALLEATMTAAARKKLSKSDYAIPESESYPIHDEAHARNALARVAQHGSPEEKAKVRAAVKRRYPNIDVS